MSQTLRCLRALADPTRIRLLALLDREELSVNELQEITGLGQSRISTHLRLLQEAGFLESRREGKRTYYGVDPAAQRTQGELLATAVEGASEIAEHHQDEVNLRRIMMRRKDQAQVYFNQVAGRFDRSYGPGRSWQAFGQMLLRLIPRFVVADLGSGEGLISELLARRAKRVIAVDNSEKMVAFGKAKAAKNGLDNLEFRLGELEAPPIAARSVDLVVLSQALHHAEQPEAAIRSAHKILRPRGQVMILDLAQHEFEQARDLYGDHWLGFQAADLHRWLEEAGFRSIEVTVVAEEETEPHFKTLLAAAEKA